jgi:Domain of unknown function (DUF4375)
MKNDEITDRFYKESVKGLNEFILKDKNLWYTYVSHLPLQLQVIYTIIVFHQQVFNGGLHQYFFNSYGQFAYLTVANLKLIKAYKTAGILEKAINQVNIDHYSIDEFREMIFKRKLDRIANFDEDLSEKLNILDNEYDSMDEDLEQLLVDYLQT